MQYILRRQFSLRSRAGCPCSSRDDLAPATLRGYRYDLRHLDVLRNTCTQQKARCDDVAPEMAKSGRKSGETLSKGRPYGALLRGWAFRPWKAAVRSELIGGRLSRRQKSRQRSTCLSILYYMKLGGRSEKSAQSDHPQPEPGWSLRFGSPVRHERVAREAPG